jgi:hypothetical protein
MSIAIAMPGMRTGFEVIGCTVVAYWAVRIVATIIDVFQPWRASRAGDPNAWD